EIVNEFIATTKDMNTYLTGLLEMRRKSPADDLPTRVIQAGVDGERLTQDEILGFFQLLLLAGSETTTNLINNAFICFVDNPDQLDLLRQKPELLPSAIEEVLRYRSPLQWMYRVTTRDAHINGKVIPAGKLVLIWMGAANRDPKQFAGPDR